MQGVVLLSKLAPHETEPELDEPEVVAPPLLVVAPVPVVPDPVVVAAPLPVVPGPLELEQAAKEITAITAAVIVRVMNPPLRCRQP